MRNKFIGKIITRQNGFSFLSILISVVIIGILASVAIVHYRTLGVFKTDRTSAASVTRKLDLNLTKNTLKQIHMMELSYHQRYNKYATFIELQREGLIQGGYTARLEAQGKPYLNYWDIEINAEEDSYLLIASPNRLANEFEDVPILAMNETGSIWEEEGLDSTTDTEETEEEIPIPFLPEGE